MRALRGLLWGSRRGARVALPCRTDLVTASAVRVRLPRNLGPLGGAFPASADKRLATRFLKQYGRDLRLRLTVGTRDAWSGPVRVCTVESCPEDPDSFRLSLGFAEPLGPAELEQLGLAPFPAPSDPFRAAIEAVQQDAPDTVRARVAPTRPGPQERRLAPRVEIEIPAQILTTQGYVAAVVRDLSRTGLRMLVQGRHVGCDGGADMEAVAAGVRVAMKPRFAVHLHHRMLGSLLARDVHMTRLAILPGVGGDVEVGGYFDEPLSSEETMALGIPLPPLAADREDWCPRADQPAPHLRTLEAGSPAPPAPDPEREPQARTAAETECVEEAVDDSSLGALQDPQTRTWRAYLRGRGEASAKVVACLADRAAPNGLRLRVDRDHARPLDESDVDDVAAFGARFVEQFGHEVVVKIMDGSRHVWSGNLALSAVELPRGGWDHMLVTLLFREPPRSSELLRLGLGRPAA